MSPKRFEVWWCNFDPTVGHEIGKARPAVVVSPDEVNAGVSWFTLAPLTTGSFAYATRVPTAFGGKTATIVVDQLRCMDRRRLIRRMGELDSETCERLLTTLAAFFAT